MSDERPELRRELARELEQHRDRLRATETERARLAEQLAARDQRIQELEATVAALSDETHRLKGQLGQRTEARPRMSVEELADHLRRAASTANAGAAARAEANEAAPFVVERIEAEIKGAIDLEDGVRLAQLDQTDAASASTLRVTLRPMVRRRVVEDEPE